MHVDDTGELGVLWRVLLGLPVGAEEALATLVDDLERGARKGGREEGREDDKVA